MLYILKIFYISIFRAINLPFMNSAMTKVTMGRLTKNSSRTAENVLSSVTNQQVSITQPPEVQKDFSVVIIKTEPKSIPKACRAKPLMGPKQPYS